MENVLALLVATAILVLIPGPNVALIVANSLRYGLKPGLVTVFGTSAGLALQLFLVVAGMASLIEKAASALLWIKWLGVLYLAYLGIRTWIKEDSDLNEIPAQSESATFWRGFALAVINPKTLLFNAAFLPQFIAGGGEATSQLPALAMIYLSVIVIGDSLWAVFASSARHAFARFRHLRNKVAGGFMLGAAAGLALSRRSL